MKRAFFAIAFVAYFTIALTMPSVAQKAEGTPFKVVKEWKEHDQLWGGYMSLSPDGRYVAYPVDNSLFLENIRTGENEAIGSGANASFSPDVKRLVFTTGSHVDFDSRVWSVNLDGSDLVRLAPGDQSITPNCTARLSDPSQLRPGCAFLESVQTVLPTSSYSPDGSKVMVLMKTNPGKRDGEGYVDTQFNEWSIAVISADRAGQEPKPLVRGADVLTPLNENFWSSDGTAIYYDALLPNCTEGNCSALFRLDLKTNQTTEVGPPIRGLGSKVPGADAVIIGNRIVSLQDPSKAWSDDQTLAVAVASIPPEDSDGRELMEVQASTSAKLLLVTYSCEVGGGEHKYNGDDCGHVQILSYE